MRPHQFFVKYLRTRSAEEAREEIRTFSLFGKRRAKLHELTKKWNDIVAKF